MLKPLCLSALSILIALPVWASNSEICKSAAITQKGRIGSAECSCTLKAADKYLAPADKAFLVQYWSGQRNDQPHVYLGRTYPSGKNKPLIKFNAYTAKKCR